MSNKGTEIVLTGDEVSTIVFALMKASAYENEYWRELAERSAKAENAMDKKEQYFTFTNNSMYYLREYTKLIQKLCRQRAKRQGGIYRQDTMQFMRSSVSDMKKYTEESIEKARCAILGKQVNTDA